MDKPRTRDGDDYGSGRFNRFSIVAQLVVDSKLKILDFCYGFPGTVGDGRASKSASLYRRGLQGSLFLDDPADPFAGERPAIAGVPGGYLLADGGYPSLPWIVTPYGQQPNLTTAMQQFHALHKIVRSCVERFFGVFKMRFQFFYRPHVTDIRREGLEFEACCILHNLFQEWGDMPQEDLEFSDASSPDTPRPRGGRGSMGLRLEFMFGHERGQAVRDALCAEVVRIVGFCRVPYEGPMVGRDFVRERRAVLNEMEKMEREVERVHKYLVERGDSITVTMRCGKSVCESEMSLENIHARRWASSVLKRLRDSRDSLPLAPRPSFVPVSNCSMQGSGSVPYFHSALLPHSSPLVVISSDLEVVDDNFVAAMSPAEADVQVARQQAETAWRFYDDIVRGVAVGTVGDNDLCHEFEALRVGGKGKAAATSSATEGGHGATCSRCGELSGRKKRAVKLPTFKRVLRLQVRMEKADLPRDPIRFRISCRLS
ncbi:hypothetical protein CBR_g40466 [Chara braunii]|uniref:DDE Tnp4 domain-containing protein n=1 Tax=Chara braunii TaxID=69332 RepID=A0A388LTT2_CHABU|nr:hypothetical protein CBR_g40466 [Chara braunii]|eukprot:GBG85738.1 hypothetical protein CBR_g40466 [Chara braunii]